MRRGGHLCSIEKGDHVCCVVVPRMFTRKLYAAGERIEQRKDVAQRQVATIRGERCY